MARLTPEELRELEEKLLEQVRSRERAYRAAVEEYRRVREEYGDESGTSDGAYAVNKAAVRERTALQHYSRALKTFTDLCIERRGPEFDTGPTDES